MHASYRSAAILVLAMCGCASSPSSELPPAPPKCPPAMAQPSFAAPKKESTTMMTRESALARLFTEKRVDPDWFARSFAKAVSPHKVEAIIADIVKDLGAYASLEKAGDDFVIVFANGKVPAKISLDAEGRIEHLWFSAPETLKPLSVAEAETRLAALPGKVGYVVMTDGAVVAEREADTPMAVGSAFKLAILEALRVKLDGASGKKAQWSDVIRLEEKHKSLPSGSLHTWPNHAPITLHTAAALMISVSDNTATDLLLDYVGRAQAEKYAPANAPFMSTREAFVLKAKANAALQARWRSADAAGRRAMLPELAAMKLDAETKLEDTPSTDIEWMLSARQLCTLLEHVKGLDVMQINPGVAKKKDWDLVAYKGGSEPGVLNMSTWAERAGKKHCVVTTWNEPKGELDQSKLFLLHGALLGALR